MTRLPYDIARCRTHTCPSAPVCARFTAPGRPDGPQAFHAFTPDARGRCGSMIRVKEADFIERFLPPACAEHQPKTTGES